MTQSLRTLTVGGLLLVPAAASAQGWPCGYYPPPVVYWQVRPMVYVPPPQVRVEPPPVDKAKAVAPPSAPPTVTPAEFKSPAEENPPRVPKVDVPTTPVVKPSLDVIPPPKPSVELPPAKPTADLRPPLAGSEKKVEPPFELKLPAFEEKPAAPPAKPDPGLPGIILPKLPPVGDKSESKYLPAGPTVQVLPVDGPAPGGDRQVGFFNYTGRDVTVGFGGRSVAVPAKGYVTAKLPAAFTWKLDGGAERTVTMPADAAGVEIILK